MGPFMRPATPHHRLEVDEWMEEHPNNTTDQSGWDDHREVVAVGVVWGIWRGKVRASTPAG